METTIHSKQVSATAYQFKSTVAETNYTSVSPFWQMVEFNRFSIMPMLLAFVAILGGIAAAITVQMETWRLAVVAVSMAIVEGFILAVMPMRLIVISSAVALLLMFLAAII